MAAGSGMKNIIALIPNVGEWEAACAEEGSHNVLFCRRNLRWGDVKQHNTHREREREAQTIISLLTKGNNYK